MQSAFFKLANIIPEDEATQYLKDSISKAYGKKGEKVVNMNYEAVEQGKNALVQINIPSSWATATDDDNSKYTRTRIYNKYIKTNKCTRRR